MLNSLKTLIAFIASMKDLLIIGFEIFRFVRTEYDSYQRKHVLQEIKEAVKESANTGDTSRLENVINPTAEPFRRDEP